MVNLDDLPRRSPDDPDCTCPLTLFRVWKRAPDQVLGVLRGVDQRGLLTELLAEYSPGEALALGTFYAALMAGEAAGATERGGAE
jgi:hypothetical protein